mmetsp:Transcript_11461/g.31964  ORF Transcript_11461/g.31964 Transcript_11461/m.31964 type:complete len:108 (-) Transcript_11461:105-428(-)
MSIKPTINHAATSAAKSEEMKSHGVDGSIERNRNSWVCLLIGEQSANCSMYGKMCLASACPLIFDINSIRNFFQTGQAKLYCVLSAIMFLNSLRYQLDDTNTAQVGN